MKELVEWKELEKKYLGPKQHLSSFGCDVVGLWGLVVLDDVGVGIGVVTVCGDGFVVVEVWWRRHRQTLMVVRQ